MNGGWYGYHSQSWVVYDVVLPTWLNSVLTSFQQRWISSFWRFFCADKSLGKAVLMCGRGNGSHWRVDVGLGFKFSATYWEEFDFCWSHPEAMHFAILYLCSSERFGINSWHLKHFKAVQSPPAFPIHPLYPVVRQPRSHVRVSPPDVGGCGKYAVKLMVLQNGKFLEHRVLWEHTFVRHVFVAFWSLR